MSEMPPAAMFRVGDCLLEAMPDGDGDDRTVFLIWHTPPQGERAAIGRVAFDTRQPTDWQARTLDGLSSYASVHPQNALLILHLRECDIPR